MGTTKLIKPSVKDIHEISFIVGQSARSAFKHLSDYDNKYFSFNNMHKEWSNYLANKDGKSFPLVAVLNSKIIGVLQAKGIDSSDLNLVKNFSRLDSVDTNKLLHIKKLYVSVNNQGEGIGSKMLRKTAKEAIDAGYTSAVVTVLNNDKNSLNFFRSVAGAQVLGTTKDEDLNVTLLYIPYLSEIMRDKTLSRNDIVVAACLKEAVNSK